MTVENNEVRADADAGEKLDKVLGYLDGFGKRLDAVCSRMDAFEEGAKAKEAKEGEQGKPEPVLDKAKKDGDGDDNGKDEDKAAAAAEKAKLDKAKKDADDEDDKKKADADAAIAKRISDLEAMIPKRVSDADFKALADVQARADSAYQAFGSRAPRPLDGESVDGYRRRLASGMKDHSATWKQTDLGKLDDHTFGVIEASIYADAIVAAKNPIDLGEGEERMVTREDPSTGQRINTFYRKGHFVRDLMPPARMIASTAAGDRR